jgi:hypothetical protein
MSCTPNAYGNVHVIPGNPKLGLGSLTEHTQYFVQKTFIYNHACHSLLFFSVYSLVMIQEDIFRPNRFVSKMFERPSQSFNDLSIG